MVVAQHLSSGHPGDLCESRGGGALIFSVHFHRQQECGRKRYDRANRPAHWLPLGRSESVSKAHRVGAGAEI